MNTSGFVFQRLGYAAQSAAMSDGIIDGFQSFPYSGAFLVVLSKVTGFGMIDTGFIPVIPIAGFVSLTLASTIFFRPRAAVLVLVTGAFIQAFADTHHYKEYQLTAAIFLLCAYGLYRYVSSERRPAYAAVVVVSYAGVKFFGQTLEVWLISLIGMLTVGIVAKKFRSKSETSYQRTPWIMMLMSGVSFFAFNNKFYGQFLENRRAGVENLLVSLIGFATGLFLTSESISPGEFVTTPSSPPLIRSINVVYYVFITVPLVVYWLHSFVKRRGRTLTDTYPALFASSLAMAAAGKIIVYAAIGKGVVLRFVMVVYPLIAGYYVHRLFDQRIFAVFATIILILPAGAYGLAIAENTSREFAGEEPAASVASWMLTDSLSPSVEVTTDHHTFGALQGSASIKGLPSRKIMLSGYSRKIVSNLTAGNDICLESDYAVINKVTINEPTRAPPGSWNYFIPVSKFRHGYQANPRLNKPYDSDSFAAYSGC